MNLKILVATSTGWMSGVALGQSFTSPPGRLLIPAAAAAIVVSLVLRRAGVCFVIACASGTVLGQVAVPPEDALLKSLASEVAHCDVAGSLVERAGAFGTVANVSSATCEMGAFRGDIGHVLVDGAPGEPGSPFSGTGRLVPFGSDGFSEGRRRTGALAEFAPDDLEVGSPRGLSAIAASIRSSARRSVSALEPRAGALSLGLVIGDTSSFEPTTEEAFRRAGLSHLVAVSGSNVAIVLGAVLLLASRLAAAVRLGLAGAALFLFVLVVGPEPSVLRAAAMGSVALIALFLGRRSEPLAALCLSGLVLSALRPSLVFSLGFWLSVAATLGIILWATDLSTLVERVTGPGKKRLWLAAAFGVTCAAQFAVAPLLALVFGKLSVAGPLANLLAVPAVPPATILGFLAAVTGTLAPPLGELFATLSHPFLAWILWIADSFGGAPWADVSVTRSIAWGLFALVAGATVASIQSREP